MQAEIILNKLRSNKKPAIFVLIFIVTGLVLVYYNRIIPSTQPDIHEKYLAKFKDGHFTLKDINDNIAILYPNGLVGGHKTFEELETQAKSDVIETVLLNKLIQKEVVKDKIAESDEYRLQHEILTTQLKQRMLLDKLFKEYINDDRLKDKYKKLQKDLQNKLELKISHILVKTEEEANDVYKRLKVGENFEELVRKYSIDNVLSGDLGYLVEGNIIKEFESVVLKLPINEISTPIKTNLGWHIAKVVDRHKVIIPEFDKIKPQLEQQVYQDFIQSYSIKLLNSSDLEINL